MLIPSQLIPIRCPYFAPLTSHDDPTADRSGLLDIAGPLCFGGDYIKKNLPVIRQPNEGDVVVVGDAGANTLSMYSRHCR